MGLSSWSGPIFSAGGYLGGGDTSIPIVGSATARIVDGSGVTGSAAYRTIQAAVDAADSGDTIYVQPGTYDENIVVTKDYITIIGAQVGRYGFPDVTATAGVPLTVTAQGFVCKRVRFASGDGSSCVAQEGNGFVYEDCVFDDASDAGAAGLLLKGDATDDDFTASEGFVRGCLFRGNAAGILFAGAEAPVAVGSTHNVIEGCRFIDNTAADLLTADNSTTNATYSVQDTIIKDCYFAEPKNKATWIDFTTANGGAAGAQTGMIVNCFFNDDTVDTTAVAIVGTGFGVVGCHSMDGEFDGSGLD